MLSNIPWFTGLGYIIMYMSVFFVAFYVTCPRVLESILNHLQQVDKPRKHIWKFSKWYIGACDDVQAQDNSSHWSVTPLYFNDSMTYISLHYVLPDKVVLTALWLTWDVEFFLCFRNQQLCRGSSRKTSYPWSNHPSPWGITESSKISGLV